MNSMIVFMVRPKIASDYSVLYQNSVLIQGRDKIENGASTPRHGWLYDAGADQEPTISELGKRSPRAMPPMPDGPAIKLFFKSATAQALPNDVFLAPNCSPKVPPWSTISCSPP